VEGVSEARKAAFGSRLSNCLRVDLKTNAMREWKQRQEYSLIAMKMSYQLQSGEMKQLTFQFMRCDAPTCVCVKNLNEHSTETAKCTN